MLELLTTLAKTWDTATAGIQQEPEDPTIIVEKVGDALDEVFQSMVDKDPWV